MRFIYEILNEDQHMYRKELTAENMEQAVEILSAAVKLVDSYVSIKNKRLIEISIRERRPQ